MLGEQDHAVTYEDGAAQLASAEGATMDSVPARLVERLRLLEGAFGAAQDAIIITDSTRPDNPIVAVNPAFTRLTGYTAEEALGRNCRFLQGEDRNQPEVARLREAIRSEREVLVTLRNYRKDGTLFWNELRMAPIRNGAGQITHFVGIQSDITGRVVAEQALVRRTADLERAHDALQEQTLQLADATQARDRFMATVSHEMRTPINAVLGYADLLDLDLQGPLTEGQRDYLSRIRRTGRGLLDLVNDVLDLTRAEFGHLEVEPCEVDPLPVAEEVAALLEGQAQQKGIVLKLAAPEGRVPTVQADRRRLRQILLNLVANAVKFTDAGTVTLRVHVERAPGSSPNASPNASPTRVGFDVTDTGIGIAADQLALVFDEFFQADPKLTRRHGGAGLGLAISRRLARLMGGDLTVTSEQGHGSTFSLWLPVFTAAGAVADQEQARVVAPATAEPTREPGVESAPTDVAATVVVFGPDEATLTYLTRTLYPDVRLLRAADPAGVAALARAEHATLIVLDVGAQGGAGWQVAHTLRDEHGLDDIPLLILPAAPPRGTDRGDHAALVAAALDLGVVAFATKPPGELAAPSTGEGGEDATRAASDAEAAGPTAAGRAATSHADIPGEEPDAEPANESAAGRLARAVGRAVASAGANAGANGRPTRGTPPDVLVVDDDADGRRVTSDVLRASGATVREATDGEAALAAMRKRRPDVAVIDLMMPVLDGFGVLAAMRADARLRGVPVVVLTTKALTPAERDYLARTAERVLEKGEYRLSDVATQILRAATGT